MKKPLIVRPEAEVERFPIVCFLSKGSEVFPLLGWPTRSGTREFGKPEFDSKKTWKSANKQF